MSISITDADSLLTIDVGTAATRAALFDIVEGNYRFIAKGEAPSTAAAPFRNVSEGVHQAIHQLQEITGRVFLNNDQQLIMPTENGTGVDTFSATMSAGPIVRTALIGLLSDVSMDSVTRLAQSTYTRIIESIHLNDSRKADDQLDSILRLRPDLIMIAGGTEGGATHSVQRMVELTGLICNLLPDDLRPAVLYAGNNALADKVQAVLQHRASLLKITPNIRPTLETEDLGPAQIDLAKTMNQIRCQQIEGVEELNSWANGNLLPTAFAFSRIIRFLSEIHDSQKGILGVDIGASAATIAAGFNGKITLGVYPHLGLGEGLARLLLHTNLYSITRWLPIDIPNEVVQDYIFHKAIYPTSLPATIEDLAIEQALTRQMLQLALAAANNNFPRAIQRLSPTLTPFFEPILASGSALTDAPSFGQSLLILLDALQPIGVTTFILDENNLLPALGATASLNPILPIQVLESGAFTGLATVITVISSARTGSPILRVRLVTPGGAETRVDVRKGNIEMLALPSDQSGRLYLKTLHRSDVGAGPGRDLEIPVSGTRLGIVIDGRGRPLDLPKDKGHRCEMIKNWLNKVAGG